MLFLCALVPGLQLYLLGTVILVFVFVLSALSALFVLVLFFFARFVLPRFVGLFLFVCSWFVCYYVIFLCALAPGL